jgi:hypothetical protein
MPTSVKNLLLNPNSYSNTVPKFNGGIVPPGSQLSVGPVPPGSRHYEYSTNGTLVNGTLPLTLVGAGFIPPIPQPSRLDEGDLFNTAPYRSTPGSRYRDNPPT